MYASRLSARPCTRRTRHPVFLVVAVLVVAALVWTVVFSSWNVCRSDLDDDVDALNAAARSSSGGSRRSTKICLSPVTDSGRRVNMSIDSDSDLRLYNVSASAAKPFTSIVHAMWKTSEIPTRWNRSAQTWVKMNKDFAYCLWTDPELEPFVADEYPWLLPTYHDYSYHIQRCDVARYMILYRYGGTYADLDVRCRTSLSELFANTPLKAGILITPTIPFGFSQDFIAVRRPRDPVVGGVLSGLRRAASSWWYLPLPYTTVMYRTGPVYFSRRVNCHDRQEEVFAIPPSQYPNYVGHVGGASWHGWDGQIIWNVYQTRYHLLRLVVILLAVAVFFRFSRTRRWIVSFLRNRL